MSLQSSEGDEGCFVSNSAMNSSLHDHSATSCNAYGSNDSSKTPTVNVIRDRSVMIEVKFLVYVSGESTSRFVAQIWMANISMNVRDPD